MGDIEPPLHPALSDVVAKIDHLIVGTELAAQVTGKGEPADMVTALSAGRACCVVTAGSCGAWYSVHGGTVRHCPAFSVPVVDTTGCGDVFHGAYSACLARGMDSDRTVRVATAVAGLKASRPGGRAGIPDWPTLERFLGKHGIQCAP